MVAKREAARPLNKSGQVLGRKGSSTRIRILEATEKLLADSRGVEPLVAAIANAAGISAPTFYLYFTDVGEAVLAVVEQLEERLEPVEALLDEPWPPEQLFARARAFVQAYFEYWLANAPGLRARNERAEQGDDRFVSLRLAATENLIQALARKIGDPPFSDGLPCDPHTMAMVLIGALERLATVYVLKLYPKVEANAEGRVNALANLIAITIRGGEVRPRHPVGIRFFGARKS